ncbi:hypothetical protein ACFWDI_27865 [Streptomyces sp. NPDC060064]|uniref:hypothetical protein n=1 Tax=Streptomyces sp. NPDC060064 TaxID=3347049 RepID=UPI00369EA62B
MREQLRDEFKTLFSDQGDTIVVYTTTEPAEAMMLGDVVLVMHEGQILQIGPPQEVFERPATTTVASIINDPPMNIFTGRIEGGQVTVAGFQATHVSPHLADLPDGAYQFGLRATDVSLASAGVEGDVTFVEISGSETFVHAVVGETPLDGSGQGPVRQGASCARAIDLASAQDDQGSGPVSAVKPSGGR